MKKLLLALLFMAPCGRADNAPFVPPDAETLPVMRKALAGKTDAVEKKVRRLGNKTLEIECLVAMAADFDRFKKIASDFPDWREWALTNINQPQGGEGDYLLQLHDLVTKAPGSLTAQYSFNLPFLKKNRARTFKLTAATSGKTFTVVGETAINEKSSVKRARAFMKALPAEGPPGVIWVMVKAVVEFRNWLVYEALPERVLLREVGDRLQYIVTNYEKEETNQRDARRRTATKPPAEDLNEDL